MDARNIEKYDVEAWVEDLSGLYYGYGNGDDLTYDPGAAMVRNFCVNRMVEHIIAIDAEMRRRRNRFLAVAGMRARHVRLLACDDASLPCWERDVR